MSTPINDGGPAFPVADSHHANGQVQYGTNGMSLRAYIATAVSPAFLAMPGPSDLAKYNGEQIREITATASVLYADALIAELNKEAK